MLTRTTCSPAAWHRGRVAAAHLPDLLRRPGAAPGPGDQSALLPPGSGRRTARPPQKRAVGEKSHPPGHFSRVGGSRYRRLDLHGAGHAAFTQALRPLSALCRCLSIGTKRGYERESGTAMRRSLKKQVGYDQAAALPFKVRCRTRSVTSISTRAMGREIYALGTNPAMM